MYCGKCGKEIKDDIKFCPYCGSETKIDSFEIEQKVQQIIKTNKGISTKKAKRITLIVGIIIIVLVFFVICVINMSKNKTISQSEKESLERVQTSSDVQDNKIDNTVMVKFTDASPFSNGVSKVKCDTNGALVDYLINTKGEILYSCDVNESITITPSNSNNIGYVFDNSTSTHKLINIKGEVIKEFKNEEIDKIIACGGDYALVYKCESNIDSKKHLFGAIDTAGEWSMPLTDIGIDFEGVTFEHNEYAGSDVFDLHLSCTLMDTGWQSVYSFNVLINAKSRKVTFFLVGLGYEDYKEWVTFDSQGNDYFVCKYSGSAYSARVSDKPLYKNGEEISDFNEYQTTHDFILKSDGTWENINEKSPLLNGFNKSGDRWLKMDSDIIEIYNPQTDKTTKYSGYALDTIEKNDVFFFNEYSVLLINGKDGKKYFTIINDNGEQKFEPIVGKMNSFVTFDSGADLSCFAYENENSLYNLIDINGNILCKDLNYSYISSFSNGIAVAESEEGEFYIDKNGNVVLDGIQVPKEKE